MTRGYLLFANNTGAVDYVKLAYACAISIKHSQPLELNSVALVTKDLATVKELNYPWVFDHVIEYTGPLGMDARSRAYDYTPYDETVLLDADMLFLKPMNHYWHFLDNYHLYLNTHPQNYKGQAFKYGYYRAIFEKYKLPDVYSAWTYFKKDPQAEEFFELVKLLTNNPMVFINKFLPASGLTSIPTDEAFALAAQILDIEDQVTSNQRIAPITHMKPMVQGWKDYSEEWSDRLRFYFNSNQNVKLGVWQQSELLHYVEKHTINKTKLEVLEWSIMNREAELHSST